MTLSELLALLSTTAENRTGYDRDLFRHWVDADGDGCNTRYEVLIAEATRAPAVGPSCSLSEGAWISLYDDVHFTDPSGMDIDHLVALAEAWDSGTYGWSSARREAFANDLGVSWSLIAVSASSNRSKGDRDPAEWLPPATGYRCTYLGDWLAVKVRWSLSVNPTERSAIQGMIGDCPYTRRPVVPASGRVQEESTSEASWDRSQPMADCHLSSLALCTTGESRTASSLSRSQWLG